MPRTKASVKPWRMLNVAMEPGVDLGAGVAIVVGVFVLLERPQREEAVEVYGFVLPTELIQGMSERLVFWLI